MTIVGLARCVSGVEGYQEVLAALLGVERDHSLTGVDIQAAKLTAQKLTENGIKGLKSIHYYTLQCDIPVR